MPILKEKKGETIMIDIKSCIEFTNENKTCFLATTENGQDRVRALCFWYADASGFYFQTGGIKEMYNQLLANPKVEVCFYRNQDSASQTLRISGSVEFVEDKG